MPFNEIENVITGQITYSKDELTTYNCHYYRIKQPPNDNVGKREVITAGFIPLKTRIENMIAAGLDLQAKREEMYPDLTELDENDSIWDDGELDEITVMERGTRSEEALERRKLKPQEVKNATPKNRENLEEETFNLREKPLLRQKQRKTREET